MTTKLKKLKADVAKGPIRPMRLKLLMPLKPLRPTKLMWPICPTRLMG